MTSVLALLHSPLTGPSAWGELPDALRHRGHRVVTVEVADDDVAPYASRYVARAALQLRDALGPAPAVLVGHSGAGYLLPLVGAARRAARAPAGGYLFVDAGLPPTRPTSRLQLARVEAPEYAGGLDRRLAAGGRFPDWTDADLRGLVPDDAARAGLLASLRPRGADFFAEVLPVAPDWPDAPCGYLQLSGPYTGAARQARLRGWPVLDRTQDWPGGHFAALVAPEQVADALADLLRRC